MKFSQMPYQRPDLAALLDEYAALAKEASAADAARLEEIYLRHNQLAAGYETAASLVMIRHTCDTTDSFYDAENDWFDQVSPQVSDAVLALYRGILQNPHKDALAARFGQILLDKMEVNVKSATPEILQLRQEENALTTAYEKLYASAKIPFDGKVLNVSQLGPYKESPDAAVRRAAYEAEAGFFDENRAQLDELYDKLVKNRTEQAKKLGYENFIPLGYIRMERLGYGQREVEQYRAQVASDVTPLAAQVMQRRMARLGIEKPTFCDLNMQFVGGNPTPMGQPEDILHAGREMYHHLSLETADFIDRMMDDGLFDVVSRPGKAPGGYCTTIPDHRAPFIFSNFNGTSGDVDVLTHEAGHAFAAYMAYKENLPGELQNPGLESCEIHSMSMEFLTSDYHTAFFGPDTGKYALAHAEDALLFLPYGCMVDEFQHIVYGNPDLTPDQRNAEWKKLEEKYRPWVDFDGLPFYGRGAGWQRQTHIYENPFYYIDYCLAQTVALQFFAAWLSDKKDAWTRYMALVRQGGRRTYAGLVESAGFAVPFEAGSLKGMVETVEHWTAAHPCNQPPEQN